MAFWLIVLLFFVIATIYSSAGFGGGSSYLAILALAMYPIEEMRVISLVCNIIVVFGSVINFHLKGLRPWTDAVLLLVASIPMAYLGGKILLPRSYFLLLLGVILLLGALLMFVDYGRFTVRKPNKASLPILGGIIGFVSGLVGIGGGIFLAPVLHLQRWKAASEIAAMSSFFIFVNSISGLIGQFSNKINIDYSKLGMLVLAVLVGGQIGNRLALQSLKPETIRFITAILISIVAINLIGKEVHVLVDIWNDLSARYFK